MRKIRTEGVPVSKRRKRIKRKKNKRKEKPKGGRN
jgi:hypothetical protein